MKNLQADIKNKAFQRVYLFFGEEQYLVNLYESNIKQAVLSEEAALMNCDVFEGKNADLTQLFQTVNTLPFFSDRRLVLVKESGLFAAGRKDDTQQVAAWVEDKGGQGLPDFCVLVFIESQVDKRNKLYKAVSKAGRCVEFQTPDEKALIDWIARSLKKEGKTIAIKDARVLIQATGGDMSLMQQEMGKLVTHCPQAMVTAHDIEAVCIKPLAVRVFDLLDAIGAKDGHKALDIFNNLVVTKQSPIMVIAVLGKQLKQLLQCKMLAEKGNPPGMIAEKMELRSFMVNNLMAQGRRFSSAKLSQLLSLCLETDISIKTGKMNDQLAVELLIIQSLA